MPSYSSSSSEPPGPDHPGKRPQRCKGSRGSASWSATRVSSNPRSSASQPRTPSCRTADLDQCATRHRMKRLERGRNRDFGFRAKKVDPRKSPLLTHLIESHIARTPLRGGVPRSSSLHNEEPPRLCAERGSQSSGRLIAARTSTWKAVEHLTTWLSHESQTSPSDYRVCQPDDPACTYGPRNTVRAAWTKKARSRIV
jgi:hypothetical protein